MLRQEFITLWTNRATGDFRKFGKTIGIVLLLLGFILNIFSSESATALIVTGGIFLVLSAFLPFALRPFYVIWMGLALILGFIMTRVLLGLFFFLIFSPIGLVFRLIKKDHLDEAMDSDAASYWKMRDSKPYEPGMSEKQS